MIHPSPSRRRPFESLASSKVELNKLLHAEHDARPVMLNDWTHDLSDSVYAQYFQTGVFPYCVDSLLANGHGRVECLPDSILQAGPGLGLDTPMGMNSSSMSGSSMGGSSMGGSSMGSSSMDTSTMDMSMDNSVAKTMAMRAMTTSGSVMDNMAMSTMPSMSTTAVASSTSAMSGMQAMTTLNPKGCVPPMMYKPGYNLTSFALQPCVNTTSPFLHIAANQSLGWLSLNLVNSGAVTKLAISLDGHSMVVYAADGEYVGLEEVNVSITDVQGSIELG